VNLHLKSILYDAHSVIIGSIVRVNNPNLGLNLHIWIHHLVLFQHRPQLGRTFPEIGRGRFGMAGGN
jgi:hypothetical protein